jgi:hypothetical protein
VKIHYGSAVGEAAGHEVRVPVIGGRELRPANQIANRSNRTGGLSDG